MESRAGDRRRFSRVNFKAKVTLTAADRQWSVALYDVSLKGMLLEEPADWSSDVVDCDVELELGEQSLIRAAGHVVRHFKGMMGFEWSNIDLDSLIELRRLLELNLGDSALIDRDLAKLFHAAEQRL